MIAGEKILITGVTGSVAEPLGRFLATDNDIWGVARFAGDGDGRRQALDDAGITTGPSTSGRARSTTCRTISRTSCTSRGCAPTSRTSRTPCGSTSRHRVRAPALPPGQGGAGHVGHGVYSGHDDPWYAYTEDDPIGQGATGRPR